MKEKEQNMKKESCYSIQCDSFDDELMKTEQIDRECTCSCAAGLVQSKQG